ILINGKQVSIHSPGMANKLGIGMVHQHFMLVKKFTVTENIILGSEPNKAGILDKKTAQQSIKELSERYGLLVNPS
ncbi:MAG: heme ABC transporter ATP-binding protein, partial [Carnobacterium sp.]